MSAVAEALERHSFRRLPHPQPHDPSWVRGHRHGRRFTAWVDVYGTLIVSATKERRSGAPKRGGRLENAASRPLAEIDAFVHGIVRK